MTLAQHVLVLHSMSSLFSSIAPLHASLDYHMQRHNILTSNIAHVDTPGFKPSDLERVDGGQFASVLNVALERTNEHHMVGADAGAASSGRVYRDLSAGAGADGNYVSLDREASKVAANHLRFDAISAITSASLRQLRYAAADGQG